MKLHSSKNKSREVRQEWNWESLIVLIEGTFLFLCVSSKLCDLKENYKEPFYFSVFFSRSSYWMVRGSQWIRTLTVLESVPMTKNCCFEITGLAYPEM